MAQPNAEQGAPDNADASRRSSKRQLRVIFGGVLIGATAGYAVAYAQSSTIVASIPFGIIAGMLGFVLGAVVSGVMHITGWCMIVGAAIGGTANLLEKGYGKAIVSGAFWGMIAGCLIGLALEKHIRKSPDCRRNLKTGEERDRSADDAADGGVH